MNAAPTAAGRRHDFPDEPHTDWRQDDTIDRLREGTGLTEIVPDRVYAEDEEAWFTFPASAPNRRLDYIFFGAGLERASARVLHPTGEPPSDHLPVLSELRIRARPKVR